MVTIYLDHQEPQRLLSGDYSLLCNLLQFSVKPIAKSIFIKIQETLELNHQST